tara:strand:- start:1884 stop:2261 length:378 start_codon:yes stop_codon:yes gene_type:complete
MDAKTKKILTKLGKEKVELNTVVNNLRAYKSGYTKYKNEGDGLINTKNRLIREMQDVQAALYKWSDVGDSILKDIIADMNKFKSMAKELGFNPEIQVDYSNANDIFTKFAKLERKYQEEAKSIKF